MVQGQPAMFRVAREDAVRQICEKLNKKLNEFLELEIYDWSLVESQGHASSFVTDLIAFLQTTFISFTNLPVSKNFNFKNYFNLIYVTSMFVIYYSQRLPK